MSYTNRLRTMRLPVLVLLAAVSIPACSGGGSGGASPTEVMSLRVTFEYRAPTKIDPQVDFATCTTKQVRFATHLHFTWNDWADRRYMTAVSDDLFTYSDIIPAGRTISVALHDPNNCLLGDVYVAPTELFVEGVRLNVVTAVSDGTGLRFRVEADGRISQ